MDERQLRKMRWLSNLFDHLAKPELRSQLTAPQLEAILTRAKIEIDAELELQATAEAEEITVGKDLAELDRIFALDSYLGE